MNRIFTSLLLFGLLLSASLCAQTSYNFPESGEINITDCDGILYDNGGPNADYLNGSFSLVLLTAGSGELISLNFQSFDMESIFDNLTIYNEDDLYGMPLATYNGNNPPTIGEDIIFDANSIYLYLNTDFTISKEGFAIAFDCFTPTDAPVADMVVPSFTCSGTVSFSDNSSNFPNSWLWDFGDGNTSVEQNPIHTYASTGNYDISLISCNNVACDTITIPTAVVYDPSSNSCNNQFVVPETGSLLTNECSGIVYDPGGANGDYPIGTHGFLIIEIPGATSIEFNFTEFNLSDQVQDFDQLQLYEGNYESGNALLIDQYVDNTLPNNGASIVIQGNVATLLFYADHSDNGGSGFALQYQAIGQDVAPIAAFETESNLVPLGSPIGFTDLSTGNPAFWDWDFGDGATSSAQNPSHAFTNPGTYLVSLTTSNCQGESTATPITITVQDAAAIDYSPSDFYFELNSEENASGTVSLSNNGIGDLVTNTFTSLSGSNTGFVFEYETDFFASEFSYNLVNADGDIIYESELTGLNTAVYSDTLNGFDWSESFTLNLFDSFGDGALNYFNVYDLGTGTILTSGDFPSGDFMEVVLTGPTVSNSGLWIDLAAGVETLGVGESIDYDFTIDATGLNGGTYETNIIILSNDPNQANIIIPITLVVTGTPEAEVSTSNIDFGDLLMGETDVASFSITNSGTDDLIFDVAAVGLGAGFSFDDLSNQTLAPGETAIYDLGFAPDAIGSFGGVINITTNSSNDFVILVSGNGLAAPSVVATPASLSAELIAGEDTTLFINLANIGEAILDFSSNDISLAQGFLFEFTTDNWAGEFSWQIVNSLGEIVLSSGTTYYDSFTTYTEVIPALPAGESYTLQLLDSFGDGALTDFTVTDLIGGQEIASGDFVGSLSQLDVPLGLPSGDFYSLSIESGSVDVDGNIDIAVNLDATGLSTGTYELNVPFSTNDPANPIISIPVTLYVIAPVVADLSSNLTFVCGNLPVQFSDASENVATSWTWDFGDGTTSVEQNPSHLYTADGIYTVSLTACNELGCDVITYANFIEVELGCYAQNIPIAGTETISVCSGNIYDSGGASGDYPEGNNGTTVIAPFGANAITLTFTEFNYEEHGDYLYIYEGESFQFGTLIGGFTGNELADTTLIINSGIVTLVESTNHFVNLSGFAATFSCGTPDPIPPVAGFTIPVTSACDYQGISFNNASDGYIETWAWDFGDGNTSTVVNPTNFYQTSGTYTITLTACNEFGCNTYSETIDIFIDNDCVISDMPISGNIVIDECDGTLFDSGGANAEYPNNTSGSVTISPFGASSVTLTFVSFNVENFFDEVIIYDGPDTLSPVLAVLTGEMDVDPITSTGPSITIQEMSDFTITRPGYEINYNCTINSNRAEFTGELESVCSGMMQLYHTSQMECDAWHWDFGDGHTSNEQHPTHQFTETGDHPITLIACMDNECDTTLNMMWVDALIPEIVVPDTVVVGEAAHFHGLTENATDWFWEMNGETADHSTPSTIFMEAGVYDVHVHLSNTNVSDDCFVTRTYSVVVVEAAEEEVVSSIEQLSVGLSIYPNPVEDILYLEWEADVNIAETQIRLLDVQGKTVWSGMWITSLDVSKLPSGFYVVEVTLRDKLPFRQQIVIK